MRHTSEEKRLNILKAAAETFAEKGYYEASIQNITERAGVSTGTFYIYYKNKEEILLSLYNEFTCKAKLMLSQIAAVKFTDAKKKLAICTVSLLRLYAEHEKLSLILLTKTIGMNKPAEKLYYRIFNEMCLIVADIISDIDNIMIKDKYIVSAAYLQVVNGLAAQWLADPTVRSLSELCYTVLRYNFNALSIEISDDYINELITAEIERTCSS